MLTITILGDEHYNEVTNEFSHHGNVVLEFEHSLVSVSKWESKFIKPFLTDDPKTAEEMLYYIECMILTKDYPSNILDALTQTNVREINEYIASPQSGTVFKETKQYRKNPEQISAELIYYWLVAYKIPFECETWHLNRLFALIRICSIKNDTGNKKSPREQAQSNAQLNEERKRQFNTNG